MTNIADTDRQEDYGDPSINLARIARLWSVLLGVTVTSEQVGLCLIAVKISRQIHKHKPDNLTDIAGYARCIERLHE